MDSQIILIGAGLGGLSAAVTLAEASVPCLLVSVQPSERAQSVMAEGGINAALNTMGEGDSPAEHAADTLRAGVDLADPAAVRGLAEAAPGIVEHLAALGAPLSRANGRLILRNFGGQKKKRTAFAQSSTGKVLMTAMIDECRKYESAGLIRRMPHHEFVSLRMTEEGCGGVWIRDTWTGELSALSGPVILTVGGLNGFFPGMTTGTTANSGDAAAILFSQGVEFANLEFIQYHPTTVQIPEKRMLISEAARGEGGHLFITRNGKPQYFMKEKYPELGDLMPRDVVSREMFRITRQTGEQVYLDLRGLPKQTWKEKLADMREELIYYLALDPAKDPVPVSPGIHYFMGGIRVDREHRTNIPFLYAAGECACQYHGANRLGANSTLGALYGGSVAARTAMSEMNARFKAPADEAAPLSLTGASPAFTAKVRDILRDGLGILRDEDTLLAALRRLEDLPDPVSELDLQRKRLAKAMLISALERRESRGAHTRTDYPERDDLHYQKTTAASFENGGIRVRFETIGK